MDNLNTTVESLFKGMDHFITTKTVVGEPITIGETIILPLVDVSFGVGAGAAVEDAKNNGATVKNAKTSGAGGLGGKITPSAVLIISNGSTRLVNVKNQDAITKVLDMVPDLLDRFTQEKKSKDVVVDEEK